MCFPYKIELEIRDEMHEALLKDLIFNAQKTFRATKGPMHDTAESFVQQFHDEVEKHIEKKHK